MKPTANHTTSSQAKLPRFTSNKDFLNYQTALTVNHFMPIMAALIQTARDIGASNYLISKKLKQYKALDIGPEAISAIVASHLKGSNETK